MGRMASQGRERFTGVATHLSKSLYLWAFDGRRNSSSYRDEILEGAEWNHSGQSHDPREICSSPISLGDLQIPEDA